MTAEKMTDAKTRAAVHQRRRSQRIDWLDIAKAYGIIAVVLGHLLSGSITAHFVYWWHMPLFFIIGGIFLKPLPHLVDWRRFWHRRLQGELLLYVVMGFLLISAYVVLHHQTVLFWTQHLMDLIYGGRTLNFYTSTFWFINAYLITIVVVTVVITVVRQPLLQFAVALAGLLLGTSYQQVTWMHINGFAMMPWSLDTVLITAFYTMVGYLLFHAHLNWITHPAAIIGILTSSAMLIWWHFMGGFTFHFSLKSHLIQSSLPAALTLAVVPVLLTLAVMVLAYLTSLVPLHGWLTVIGRHTLAIMYGHKLFLDVCLLVGIVNHPVLRLIIAVGGPLLIALAIQWLLPKWHRFRPVNATLTIG